MSSMTPSLPLSAQQQPVSFFIRVSIHFMYTFISLYFFQNTFFTTTYTTTVSKYSLLCICPFTLCTHLSLFTSSMTPSSPLPAQHQLVSTCTLVFMHVSNPSTLCTHLSLFTSSMTPSSPLPAQQQLVSTLVLMYVSICFIYTFVSLYILHDTLFTTTCKTTVCKYSCFSNYVHICLSLRPP